MAMKSKQASPRRPRSKSPSKKASNSKPGSGSSSGTTKTKTKTIAANSGQSNNNSNNNIGPDKALVERAVGALLNHVNKSKASKSDLLQDDEIIQVQLSLQMAPSSSSPKPIRVMIPNPLFRCAVGEKKAASADAEEAEICIIVKESAKPWVQEMLDKHPEQLKGVKKVLGLQSLRKKHAQYKQRRELLQKYNLFMADDRILPMLSKHLGSDFFKAKKLPIPIKVSREESFPHSVQRALGATFMTLSSGTCLTIRAGHTGMDEDSLVDNIVAICNEAPEKVPRKWSNVQMISIKTPNSVSLPIYNKTPQALKEIAEMAGLKPIQASEKSKQLLEKIDHPPQDSSEATQASSSKDDKKTANGEKAGTKRKVNKSIQSPLLQALKKQKNEEKDKKKKNKKPTASSTAAATATTTTTESPRKRKKEDDVVTDTATATAATTPEQSKGKRRKSTETDAKSPKSAKKSSEDADASPAKSPKPSKKAKPSDDFIAAKRFKGSKKGYVYKMGTQGLGYYVDVKPVVDKMAIEAIMRMKKQSRRGGQRNNSKKNKYKGTRRF